MPIVTVRRNINPLPNRTAHPSSRRTGHYSNEYMLTQFYRLLALCESAIRLSYIATRQYTTLSPAKSQSGVDNPPNAWGQLPRAALQSFLPPRTTVCFFAPAVRARLPPPNGTIVG